MVHFGHVGADEGLRAALTAHIDKGSGAVVMVNSDSGQIVNEILRSIADEYEWRDYLTAPIEAVQVAPAILDAYAGRYLVDPDRVLTMTREGDKILAQPTASPKEELAPISDSSSIPTTRAHARR